MQVDSATLHLDRDDIRRSVIMCATGLRIKIDTTHTRKIRQQLRKPENRKVQPMVSNSS